MDDRIEYSYNNENLGFGKAHNLCIRKILNKSSYHLVLNPDVFFKRGVLEGLKAFMDTNKDVGLVAPKIVYPNGDLQYSCRLLPQPFDFWIRQLPIFRNIFSKRVHFQELQFTNYNQIMDVPFLLGCFMFVRTPVFSTVGMFDERYFMYLEDLDLTRTIHATHRTVFFPSVEVFHIYAKESHRNLKLLKVHLESLISYYNKWGWLSLGKTSRINKEIVKKLKRI